MNDTKRTLKLQAENMDSMFVRILLGSVNDRILNSRSEFEKKFNEECKAIYEDILVKRGEPID